MVPTRPKWGKIVLAKAGELGWNRVLSNTAKDLLLGLHSEMRWGGEIRMRVKDMAAKMGVSPNSASTALRELITHGVIVRGDLPASFFFTPEWLDRGSGPAEDTEGPRVACEQPGAQPTSEEPT